MANISDWLEQLQNEEPIDPQAIRERIIVKLREIFDPEIPVNIYDLGLIYSVEVDALGVAEIEMTLTTPACPVAQTFPGTVETEVRAVDGVTAAQVELVWDPPWSPDSLSDEVKLDLGLL